MGLRSVRGLAIIVLAGLLACANAAETVSPTTAGASTAAGAANAAAPDASMRPQFRIRPVDDSWRTNLPRTADAATQAYLDRLPVKEVKIDQSFVLRIEQGIADPTVLSATIGLAHDLGLRVVAEGVESEVARVLVRDLGVDLYQGYGLARPMTAPDVLGWLERR